MLGTKYRHLIKFLCSFSGAHIYFVQKDFYRQVCSWRTAIVCLMDTYGQGFSRFTLCMSPTTLLL